MNHHSTAVLTKKPFLPDFVAACSRGDYASAALHLQPEEKPLHHLRNAPSSEAAGTHRRPSRTAA